MTGDNTASELAGNRPTEERQLQAKLDAGTISDEEYARLTALRFGKDPAVFSFADAAEFYGLTKAELREEMAWLSDSPDEGD